MASTDRRLHWMNVLFPSDINFPGNTDGIIAPSGLTAERPVTPVNGTIRYNTTNNNLEGFVNSTWVIIGDGGSGGITTFTGLSDTPNSYAGAANQFLRVNLGATGLEFVDGDTLYLPLSGGTMDPGVHITMAGGTVKGVPSPQFNSDAANKEYVDGIAAGLTVKESVHSATTGPINLATQGLAGIDGHVPYLDGERVLVKDQLDPTENGIYAAHTGPWTRTTDMDGTPANEVQGGTTTYVQDGIVNGNTSWVVIWHGNVDVGTDPMNWSQLASPSTQDIWETIAGDAGSVGASSPNDTLTIAGGTGISTAMAGTTLTITNDSPNAVQDVFKTFTGDTGTAVASGDSSVMSIVGGAGISVAISNTPDVITISASGGAISDRIQDADNNTFVETDFGGADSNHLRLQTGVNLGNGGEMSFVTSGGAVGSNGGDIVMESGKGGFHDGGPGPGYGGNIVVTAGDGGDADTGSQVAESGGDIFITAGNGGYAYAVGNGGHVTISGGDQGSPVLYGNTANGGDVKLVPGTGGVINGFVELGLASHKWPNTDGSGGEVLTTDGAGNLSFAAAVAAAVELPRPYDLAAQTLGEVVASALVFKFVAPRDMILFDFGHQAQSETAPPATADFDVTLNGSTIGTMRYLTSGRVTFDFGGTGGFPGTSAGATQHAVARGDIIRIIAPATSTTGFDDVSITLRGGVEPNIPVGTLTAAFAAISNPILSNQVTLTLNITGEYTHIEYSVVGYGTDGTNWYPMNDPAGGVTTGGSIGFRFIDEPGFPYAHSESEYFTTTDTTPTVRNNMGPNDLWMRLQATVYGPAGIVTDFVDVHYVDLA